MKKITSCLFFLSFLFPAFGQNQVTNWPDQLKAQFQAYSQQQPEKLYLHTDRSVYASADTVWFKAYLLDFETNNLHPVPEILYLDLVSDKNVTLISQRLQTAGGYKAGSLILPDTLKTGNYQLRAYTNFQRNAGQASYFTKELFVNKIPAKTPGGSGEKLLRNVMFFPEGGSYLPGLESKIAFKAVSTTGELMPVEGKILDETGKTVTTFRSKTGYGSFQLKPQAGKMYRAQIENVRKQEFNLPLAEKRYALTLKNSQDSVTVTLAAIDKNETAYLVLQHAGQLLVTDSVKFNANGLRKRRFAKTNWPEGMMQATLFNAEGLPENERTFFNYRVPVQAKFETAKKVYGRREPVALHVTLKDAAGNPVQTELSVAVTNKFPAPGPNLRETILLQAEIANSRNPEILDDVLLTQPARFNWSAIQNFKNEPATFARETELNRLGKIMENGNAIGQAIIYLLETNSGETHLVTSDAQSQFQVPLSGSRFFYQVWQNGIWRQQAKLLLVNAGNLGEAENWNPTTATDSAQTNQFKLRRQIDRMYLREAEAPKFTLVNKEMWPSYPADKHYPLAEYTEFNTMEEILREMVPEVRVITRKKKVQANMYDSDRRVFFLHQPLYIIDGQPTWDNDLFLRLDASQLEQVNIYNSSRTLKSFGFMGNQGVIVVFTKSRNYQNPELRTENILTIPGQQATVQYKPSERPANIPDFRPTLFWNPQVQTNAEGKATIHFRTTDEMGDLKVRVEGVTKNGQLISEEFLIQVKPAQ